MKSWSEDRFLDYSTLVFSVCDLFMIEIVKVKNEMLLIAGHRIYKSHIIWAVQYPDLRKLNLFLADMP